MDFLKFNIKNRILYLINMNRWKLFIDDIRFPIEDDFIIARNVNEALYLIDKNGFPSFISFDHDLGENESSGYEFIKIIEEKTLNKEWDIPNYFEYNVHSDNIIGAENIRVHFNNLLNFLGVDFSLDRIKPSMFRENKKNG